MIKSKFAAMAVVIIAALSFGISAQETGEAAALVGAQREAMVPFAMMDGIWRGTAWTMRPSGEKHTITMTERIGPFLNGSVKVIEGKGYEPDGRVSFNALGILFYNPVTRAYTFRTYGHGRSGDFVLKPTPEGYVWEIPESGDATVRFTAVIKDGTYHLVGDQIVPKKGPVRFFEMTLKRLGDTTWPAGGAIPPK